MTGYRGVYDPVGAVAVSEEERQREVAGIREAASSRSWSRAGSIAKRLLGSLGLGSSRRLLSGLLRAGGYGSGSFG